MSQSHSGIQSSCTEDAKSPHNPGMEAKQRLGWLLHQRRSSHHLDQVNHQAHPEHAGRETHAEWETCGKVRGVVPIHNHLNKSHIYLYIYIYEFLYIYIHKHI